MLLDDEYQKKETLLELTDKEVFTEIWTSPKRVFTFIEQTNYQKYMMLLLALSGVFRAFDQAIQKNTGDTMSLLAIILINVIGGAVGGLILSYIYSALMSWAGSWFGSNTTTDDMVRTLAYSNIPVMISLIIMIVTLIIFGHDLFKTTFGGSHTASAIYLVTGFGIIQIALGIWSFVLLVAGISVLCKVSNGKAFLISILPALMLIIPITLIVLMFVL